MCTPWNHRLPFGICEDLQGLATKQRDVDPSSPTRQNRQPRRLAPFLATSKEEAPRRSVKTARLVPLRVWPLLNSLTWKWTMASWKTTFLYKQGVFHFHVSQSECMAPTQGPGSRLGWCSPPTTTTNGDRSEERLPMHHRAVGRRLDADLPLGWGEVVR